MYAPNKRSSKSNKQKLIEMKREIAEKQLYLEISTPFPQQPIQKVDREFVSTQ